MPEVRLSGFGVEDSGDCKQQETQGYTP